MAQGPCSFHLISKITCILHILQTFGEIQALLEDSEEDLKDESDKEMYEGGEEMGSPESSKAKESDNSPDASNSESSSSCSETFKPFDNYVPVTERVLHEEAIASYADLKWSIKDFHATTFQKYKNTDVALKNYQKIITQFKFDHVEGLKRILTNLQEVQNVIKEDPALNKKVIEAAEAYTKNSTNLIKLFTLNDHHAKWVESSASMAWSDSPRMTRIENT
ncbi:hypothetical protein Tco_1551986, partial [Tanacetum coccineum]